MRIKVLVAVTGIVALFMICSCAKKQEQSEAKENGLKSLDDLRGSGLSDADRDAMREQAAKQSGNKLNEKVKEAEKNKKNNGKSSDSDNSGKSSAEKIADSMVDDKYSNALSRKELSETLRVAAGHAKKKYNKDAETNDLKPVDDNSEEYKKYPLYSIGNIIIYEYDNNGKTVCIAVGRINADADWKVLNKK